MEHDTALVTTITAGLALAFALGLVAVRLRLPPILGYLVAGAAVGPFTPGYVADGDLAGQLAEIGVMLLMFGVGLHFSVADLLAVRRVAVPGALVQIALATALGAVVAHAWGWPWGGGVVFGLALSVASTVVLLRALEDRGLVQSEAGRIAVGWLIVEDLLMVLALVLLPVLAPILGGGAPTGAPAGAAAVPDGPPGVPAGSGFLVAVGVTLLKLGGFVAAMRYGGRRLVPWVLRRTVGTGSRELFTVGVLAISLGIAVGAAALFDVSFALGAFFAGVIVADGEHAHEAAEHALPLQDAFAVLFFVSVGMLFDPRVLVDRPWQVLATVATIVVGKSVGAFALVRLLGLPSRTALTISAALAQVGEFSFILVALGMELGLLPKEAQSLVVAGALLSIALNPAAFGLVGRTDARARDALADGAPIPVSGASAASAPPPR